MHNSCPARPSNQRKTAKTSKRGGEAASKVENGKDDEGAKLEDVEARDENLMSQTTESRPEECTSTSYS